MEDKLISIIIPVYNAQVYLDRCIHSVMKQDYRFFELILVDDGSTDQSKTIIEDWAQKDNRIRVFHKENGGQSSARNLGLDQAKGEYISFIDSDDYVTSDYLSYLLSLFVPECLVTVCNHWIVRGEKKKKNCYSGKHIFSRKEAFEEVLFHGSIDVAPWGKLYRKEVFAGLRFPSGRIFEDTWLFGDILNKTDKISFGDRCCYYYVIHEQSTVRKKYSTDNLQYIEAASKLAKDAEFCSSALGLAGVRRVNHARLSVLRYMNNSNDVEIKTRLREEVLRDYPKYKNLPRTPKRDKIAVGLLRRGFPFFYFGWSLYEKVR